MKWLPVVILAIIGVLAGILAFEYYFVSIHSLPSFVPGHRSANGHYHKRGLLSAVVAVAALAGAAILARRIVRSEGVGQPIAERSGEEVSRNSQDPPLAGPPPEAADNSDA